MLKDRFENEISIEEMSDLHPDEYVLVDIRDEISHDYGCIPSSVSMENIIDLSKEGKLDKERSYILYCMHGSQSSNAANELRHMGYDALSLKDGYASWLKESIGRTDPKIRIKAEESILNEYKDKLYIPFSKAIDEFELIEDGDKIAVCISGGKDSMLMAKLFQVYKNKSDKNFDLMFLVMDPGYSELNRMLIEDNARKLGVNITIFESSIFNIVDNVDKSPCYLCARMRRGNLYATAKEHGFNKIALGHHFDDAIETILMGISYAGNYQTMMPKLKSDNFEGMELIRPMYLIREKDIIEWRDYNGLHFIQCACHFTDTCSSCRDDGTSISKRMETKKLIERLKKDIPDIEKNIYESSKNIILDSIIEYKKGKDKHTFLENYKNKTA
ncbi:MAG: ATP-binding protein [Erysipelotrichaceae bacterium]|nr:ATP-binding protein [Erysipelotrichaceae bacterium]